jgi:hypothetical protein
MQTSAINRRNPSTSPSPTDLRYGLLILPQPRLLPSPLGRYARYANILLLAGGGRQRASAPPSIILLLDAGPVVPPAVEGVGRVFAALGGGDTLGKYRTPLPCPLLAPLRTWIFVRRGCRSVSRHLCPCALCGRPSCASSIAPSILSLHATIPHPCRKRNVIVGATTYFQMKAAVHRPTFNNVCSTRIVHLDGTKGHQG